MNEQLLINILGYVLIIILFVLLIFWPVYFYFTSDRHARAQHRRWVRKAIARDRAQGDE